MTMIKSFARHGFMAGCFVGAAAALASDFSRLDFGKPGYGLYLLLLVAGYAAVRTYDELHPLRRRPEWWLSAAGSSPVLFVFGALAGGALKGFFGVSGQEVVVLGGLTAVAVSLATQYRRIEGLETEATSSHPDLTPLALQQLSTPFMRPDEGGVYPGDELFQGQPYAEIPVSTASMISEPVCFSSPEYPVVTYEVPEGPGFNPATGLPLQYEYGPDIAGNAFGFDHP